MVRRAASLVFLCFLFGCALTAAACGSSSVATVPPQPNGASCTSRAECQSNACVGVLCGQGVPLDGACTTDQECPDGTCVAGANGKTVCTLKCTGVGTTGCNHGASTAWVCDGATFHPFGECATCSAGAGIPQTYVTCGDAVLKMADPDAPCTDVNDGACTLDHTKVLSCVNGAWKVVDTCTGAAPYCGHLAAGTGTCPSTAKYGCAGCGI